MYLSPSVKSGLTGPPSRIARMNSSSASQRRRSASGISIGLISSPFFAPRISPTSSVARLTIRVPSLPWISQRFGWGWCDVPAMW